MTTRKTGKTAAAKEPAAKAAAGPASARTSKPAKTKTKTSTAKKPAAKAKAKTADKDAAEKPKKVAKPAAKKSAKPTTTKSVKVAEASTDDPNTAADLQAGGDLLRQLREQADDGKGGHGLTHAALAKRLGTTAAKLKTLEGGGGGDGVSFALLQAAARACGLDLTITVASDATAAAEPATAAVVDEPKAPTPAPPPPLPQSEVLPSPVSDEPPAKADDERPAPRNDGPLASASSRVGLQAALGHQGRHLLRTLDGLADSGHQRDIVRRFRMGESPAAIAASLNMSPAHVIELLRSMGFRTRKGDRQDSGPTGVAGNTAADQPFERRRSLAALTGGDGPGETDGTIAQHGGGVRVGRRATDPTVTNGGVDLPLPTGAIGKLSGIDND